MNPGFAAEWHPTKTSREIRQIQGLGHIRYFDGSVNKVMNGVPLAVIDLMVMVVPIAPEELLSRVIQILQLSIQRWLPNGIQRRIKIELLSSSREVAIQKSGGSAIKGMNGKHPLTLGIVGVGALHVQNQDLGLPIPDGSIFTS
jgi:hypothetical protein